MRKNLPGRDVMNVCLRMLAGSATIAISGVAYGAIDDDNAFTPGGGDGGGELFLSVIDRGAPEPMSYVRDLGITAQQFIDNDSSSYSLSFAADDNLQTLLANPGGTVAWNIAAIHNDYGPSYDDLGYLTTAPLTAPPVANVNTLTGIIGLQGGITQAGQYLQSTNIAMGDDNSVLITAPDANAFYDGPFWGPTWHTSLHGTEAGLDEGLGFYYVATDLTTDPTGNSSRVAPFLGQWMLATDGGLTYGVPLPPAVWLLASALVGLASMSRRQVGQGATLNPVVT